MSPPCKVRRIDDCIWAPRGGDVIEYEFDCVSQLDYDGKYSPTEEIEGVPLKIHINKEEEDGEEFLCVFLVCDAYKSTRWSADVWHVQYLCHYNDAKHDICEDLGTNTFKYDSNTNLYGSSMLKWSELRNEENGFIKDDKILVRISVDVVKVTGVMDDSKFEFGQPSEPYQNVVLVIGDERIHACKEFLAIHSPVFKSMFFGAYDEKDKKEIPLNDVDPNEFEEMLAVLYPSGEKITDSTVSFILSLADRFQIKALIDSAENYLISSETLKLAFKLLLSDKFRLVKLQSHLKTQFKTPMEVTKLKDSTEYGELSETARSTMLERMIELVKEQDQEESSDDESIV